MGDEVVMERRQERERAGRDQAEDRGRKAASRPRERPHFEHYGPFSRGRINGAWLQCSLQPSHVTEVGRHHSIHIAFAGLPASQQSASGPGSGYREVGAERTLED